MIPAAAVEAAIAAYYEHGEPDSEKEELAAMQAAIEAAAPFIRADAIEESAALVASEEEHQWHRNSQHLPGAQIVAQRMSVLVRILRARAESERTAK